MTKAGCMACHAKDKKLVGPAFKDIAAKYKGQDVVATLMREGAQGRQGHLRPDPDGAQPARQDQRRRPEGGRRVDPEDLMRLSMRRALAAALRARCCRCSRWRRRRAASADAARARSSALVRMVRQDCGSCHGMRLTGGLGPALTREALADKPLEAWPRPSSTAGPARRCRPGASMLSEPTKRAGSPQRLLAGFPEEAETADEAPHLLAGRWPPCRRSPRWRLRRLRRARLRGTGDLGVVVERANGTLHLVDTTTRRRCSARSPGLGDLSHASVVFSRDGAIAYVFGRDGGLTQVNLLDAPHRARA